MGDTPTEKPIERPVVKKQPEPPKLDVAAAAVSLPPKLLTPPAQPKPPAPSPMPPPKPSTPPKPPAPTKPAPLPVNGGLRVSLIPASEDQVGPDLKRKVLLLAFILVVETIIIGGAYYFISQKETALVKAKEDILAEHQQLRDSLTKQEEEAQKIIRFQKQVTAVAQTLNEHVFWSDLFQMLESKTQTDVRFTSFTGDSGAGTVSLDAIGRSYRAVAEQIVLFEDADFVEQARTTAAAAQVDPKGEITGVSFSVALKIKPEAWRRLKIEPQK